MIVEIGLSSACSAVFCTVDCCCSELCSGLANPSRILPAEAQSRVASRSSRGPSESQRGSDVALECEFRIPVYRTRPRSSSWRSEFHRVHCTERNLGSAVSQPACPRISDFRFLSVGFRLLFRTRRNNALWCRPNPGTRWSSSRVLGSIADREPELPVRGKPRYAYCQTVEARVCANTLSRESMIPWTADGSLSQVKKQRHI